MQLIHHLIVGNADFAPSVEQLQLVVEEFQKPVPVFTVPIEIVQIKKSQNERLVVQIVDRDWNLTNKEIEALRAQFTIADDLGAIISTRHGVQVTVVLDSLTV